MEPLLSEQFLTQYKAAENPLSPIGEFVYLRTYSRYLEDKKRRETWDETVLRAVLYNCRLGINYQIKNHMPVDWKREQKEAQDLFDNLFHLRTFTSGRTLYMGGTEAVKDYPLANYNCSFTNLEGYKDLVEVFYLLMVGSGVGVRINRKYLNHFPVTRNIPVEGVYNAEIRKTMPKELMEHTGLMPDPAEPGVLVLSVGDSKEGWCEALEAYFNIFTLKEYENLKKLVIDYSYVRPEGERLKRFGGRASGHASLKRMFEKMNMIFMKRAGGCLKSIDLLDLAAIISENVVSGGVRRSALMIICDAEDEELVHAKSDLYRFTDGRWEENPEISHRRMSNNSILYFSRPPLEKIREIMASIRINGEPGFINGAEAKRRKPEFEGCNPCGEILLKSKQCCNLTTNNLMAFVEGDILNIGHLKEVLRLSTRAAIRMTLVEAELPDWNKVMQEDRIIGVSLTGMMDMVNKTCMSYAQLASLLSTLRETVHEEGIRYCGELGIAAPALMTTIKPEGTLSILPCVSSGIHFSHSGYYIRRIRISASDPLCRLAQLQGSYPVYPEYGQADEQVNVIEFPVKAPEGKTKYEVSAVEQLELYKLSMTYWSDHNTSVTVHVRDQEWEEVARWIYDNFDYMVGITLLPFSEETYPLMPYERTTKEDYEARVKRIKPIDYKLLTELEDAQEREIIDKDCDSGVCPIR